MPILHTKSSGLTMVLALSTALLAGCGESKQPATQVVAKVNKDEITSHQVDYLASKARIAPEAAAQAKKQILERLVDQQLAVQQAIERKLDRSPEVITALDMARREILARAYVASLGATVAEPSEAEAKSYYSEHPEIFSQRRAFVLQEISLPAANAPKDLIRAQVAANKPLTEISALLKKENIPHSANAAKVTSEQVPLPMLTKVNQLKDGQTGLVETPQTLFLVRVTNSEPAPIDEKSAQRPIRQLLSMQKSRDVVSQHIAELKQRASIEYLNPDYAPTASAGAAPAKTASGTAAPAAAPATASAPTAGASGSTGDVGNAAASGTHTGAVNVESGIKGFR
jgi:EpsD family peptidyl-prolyl cis-trans isomerase